MKTRGKSINLFLMDGTSKGRIKCTLSNWTGVAYKIPRLELDKCQDLKVLSQSGVYLLFGISEETEDVVVYIGQAGIRKNGDGLLNRLLEHKRNPEKDYWTEAVLFTTTNNSFGPTEISYLENRFCRIAQDVSRYKVKNGNEPNSGNITEEKECELEEFIDYAKIVMGTLGHNLFEELTEKPKISQDEDEKSDELELFLKRKSKKSGFVIEASCKQTNEGFVVLKGSMIEIIDSNSIPPSVKKCRENANINENGMLNENILFKSPSYAAAFILGGHVNGLTEWKTIEGKSLKELEQYVEKSKDSL